MSQNEHREFNPVSGRRGVTAWRRSPEYPEWSISIDYGDTGYECEPGTCGEKKETALKDIDTAIKELGEMKKYIEEEL